MFSANPKNTLFSAQFEMGLLNEISWNIDLRKLPELRLHTSITALAEIATLLQLSYSLYSFNLGRTAFVFDESDPRNGSDERKFESAAWNSVTVAVEQ